MAITEHQHHPEQSPSSYSSSTTSCLLDDASFYCEEERLIDYDDDGEVVTDTTSHSLFCNLFEQDLFWEDEELLSLFSKEQEQIFETDPSLSLTRRESVEWMLKVNAHYGFSTLTSILAINFLDRFLSTPYYQRDKPWMIQLVAVTCLSLAAKVEETQVPLLLDFQVEDSKYVFEAKTIQRMELLVLSALKWKMHPVTPLSFLDHIVRRLGLKSNLHCEFLKKCERLLISVVSDSRSIRYLPSVLATATMMNVIDQIEHFNPKDYQSQLLGVLKISQEKVKDCYGLILEVSKTRDDSNNGYYCIEKKQSQKRKCNEATAMEARSSSSPSGVIDGFFFRSDSSNDSWGLGGSSVSSPSPLFKKSRTQEPMGGGVCGWNQSSIMASERETKRRMQETESICCSSLNCPFKSPQL